MILSKWETELIRFNKNDFQLQVPFALFEESVTGFVNAEGKVDELGHLGIVVNYDVLISMSDTNLPVIDYSRKFECAIMRFGSIETDLPILEEFIKNAFINVEIDIQQKLPKLPTLRNPDFSLLAARLMELLVDNGLY